MKYSARNFFVVALLSLTSCGDGYIKCDNLTVGYTSYSSEKEVLLFVYAYKAKNAPESANLSGENHDILYAYRSFEKSSVKGKVLIPKTGTYHYGSSNLYDLEVTYSGNMGTYISYTTVYYSSSKKLVKIEIAGNKPYKNNHVKDLEGKRLFPITTKNASEEIVELDVSASLYYLYPYFTSDVSIKFVEIGDSPVSYTLYKD